MTITAREITKILRDAGFSGITSRQVAPGLVSVTQKYAVRGALTPFDLRSRRTARAKMAAEVLRAEGYRADHIDDRIRVAAKEEQS